MGKNKRRKAFKLTKKNLSKHDVEKRSAFLILQKSTMCEAVLKQLTKEREKSKNYYHRFRIIGNNMSKRMIYKSFNQLVESGTFHPVKFTLTANDCTFLVKSCMDLITKIMSLNFMVPRYKNTNHNTDEYFESVAIVFNYLKVDAMPSFRDNMLDILHKRISGDVIDLRNFSEDPDLDSIFLIENKHQLSVVMRRITQIRKWEPKTILLADNYISDITELAFVSKSVTTLDLSNNLIADIESLKVLKEFKELKSLNLLGNPICKKSEYKSVVLKYCPSLTRLEDDTVCDTSLTPVSLEYKRNFICCNEAEDLAATFLEHFFTLYDRSRSDLISLYSSHALFSVNANIVPNQKNSDSVTLEHYGLSTPFTVYKLSEIMSVFAEFPKSYHDPYPMVCDVTIFTKTTACLIVSGIFRELNQVLSFTRSFYFRRMGDIMSITNEQLHVNNATDVQTGWSFCFPLDVKYFGNPLPYYYEQYSKLEEVMCKITNLNLTYARKYLVNCNYDLKKALQIFGNLHVNDEVPEAAFEKEKKEETSLGEEKLPLNAYLRKKVLDRHEEITVKTTWNTLNQDRIQANCDPLPQTNPTIDKWYKIPYYERVNQFGFKIPESVWKLQNVVLPNREKQYSKISGKSPVNEKKIEPRLDKTSLAFRLAMSSSRVLQEVPRSLVNVGSSNSVVQVPSAEPSSTMALPSSSNTKTKRKTSVVTGTDNPLLRLANRIAHNKEMALRTLQNLNAEGKSADTSGSVKIGPATCSPSTVTSDQRPQGSSGTESTSIELSEPGSSRHRTQESNKQHLGDGQRPSRSAMAFVKGSVNSDIIQLLKKGIQDQQASVEKVKSIISAKEKRMATLKEQRTTVIDLTSKNTEVVESKISETKKSSKPTEAKKSSKPTEAKKSSKPTEVAQSSESNNEKSTSTDVKQTVSAKEKLPQSAITISKPVDLKQADKSKPKGTQKSNLIQSQLVDNDTNKSDTQKPTLPQTSKQSISTTNKQSELTDNKQVQLSDVKQSQPSKADDKVIQLSGSQASECVKSTPTNIKQNKQVEGSDDQSVTIKGPVDTKHAEVEDSVSETAVILHSQQVEVEESQTTDDKESELADNKEVHQRESGIGEFQPTDSIIQPERDEVLKQPEATVTESSDQANVALGNQTSTDNDKMRSNTSKEMKSELIVCEKSGDVKICIPDPADNPELSTNLTPKVFTNEFKEADKLEVEHKRSKEKVIKLEATDTPETCKIKDNEEIDCKRIKLETPLKSETLSSIKPEDKSKTEIKDTPKKIKQIKQKDMFKTDKSLMANFKRQLIIRLRRMTEEEINPIIRHQKVPSDGTERTSQRAMTKHTNKADSTVKTKRLRISLPKMSIDHLKPYSSHIIQENVDNASSFKNKPTGETLQKAVSKETKTIKTDPDHSELKRKKSEASASQPILEERDDAGVSQCNPIESKPSYVVSEQETGLSHAKEEKIDNTARSKSNTLDSNQSNSNTKPDQSDPKHIESLPRSRAEKRKDKSSTTKSSSVKHKRPKPSVEVTEKPMVVDDMSLTNPVDKKLKRRFKIPKVSEVDTHGGTIVKEDQTQGVEVTRSILQNYTDEQMTYDKRNSQRIAGNLSEQKEDTHTSESKILENKEILDNREDAQSKDSKLSEKGDSKKSDKNVFDANSSGATKLIDVTTKDQISHANPIAKPKIPKLPKEESNIMEIEDNATTSVDLIATKGIKINLKTKLSSPSKQQITASNKEDINDTPASLINVDPEIQTQLTKDCQIVDQVKLKGIKLNLITQLKNPSKRQITESDNDIIVVSTSCNIDELKVPLAHTADSSDSSGIVETEQSKNLADCSKKPEMAMEKTLPTGICLSENLASDKNEPLKNPHSEEDQKKEGDTKEIKNSQLSLLTLEVDDSSGDDDDLLNFFK